MKYSDYIFANTNNLTVNPKSPYDFTLDVTVNRIPVFNPTGPGLVRVTMELTNESEETQDIVVILAAYDKNGSMINAKGQFTYFPRYFNRRVAPGASVEITTMFSLYMKSVKAFACDGTSLENSTLTPKTPVVQVLRLLDR